MTRISRVLRRVSRKTRAVPMEYILAGGAFLVGPLCGWILWSAALSNLVSYQLETPMRAVVQGRTDEAVDKVRDLMKPDGEFMQTWAQRAKAFGLAGAHRLEFIDDKQGGGSFRLRCTGRPLREARVTLSWACERLSKETPLELAAPNYDKQHADLSREIDELNAQIKNMGDGKARDDGAAPPDDLRVKLALAEADLKAAQRQRDAVRDKAQLQARLRDLEKEQASATPARLSQPERDRLSSERDRLQRMMARVDREDCTETHPLIRRLAQINTTLRSADLPKLIADVRAELAEADRLQKVLEEKKSAYQDISTKHNEAQARAFKIIAQNDKAAAERSEMQERLRNKQAQRDALEKQPRYQVRISEQDPDAGPTVETRGAWLGWVCLLFGAGLGIFLAVVSYRFAALRLSIIDDEAMLADKLHVPVLGSVPRMAALAKH